MAKNGELHNECRCVMQIIIRQLYEPCILQHQQLVIWIKICENDRSSKKPLSSFPGDILSLFASSGRPRCCLDYGIVVCKHGKYIILIKKRSIVKYRRLS